jgi:hypothetical protein
MRKDTAAEGHATTEDLIITKAGPTQRLRNRSTGPMLLWTVGNRTSHGHTLVKSSMLTRW